MKKEKGSFLQNSAVQSLLASLICIVLGLFVGFIVLLIINPSGAVDAILTIIKNFLVFPNGKIALDCWDRLGGMLKVDPVQATPEWENVIYEVEKEVDEELKDEPRGMGFCFSYWSAKRAALARRGIEWRSPSVMNPRVMFD